MKISPLFFLSGLGMVSVGVAAGGYAVASLGGSGGLLLWGGFAWFFSVFLKMAWALPTNKKVIPAISQKVPGRLAGPVSWAYVGALTGIFECGFVALLVQFLPTLREATWNQVLTFGLGFGGMEAFVLGVVRTVSLFFPEKMSQEDRDSYTINLNSILLLPLGAVERINALLVHLFTCALVVLAYQRGNSAYFLSAFFFKSLVDAFAAWMIMARGLKEEGRAGVLWAYQLVFIAFGVVSYAGVLGL